MACASLVAGVIRSVSKTKKQKKTYVTRIHGVAEKKPVGIIRAKRKKKENESEESYVNTILSIKKASTLEALVQIIASSVASIVQRSRNQRVSHIVQRVGFGFFYKRKVGFLAACRTGHPEEASGDRSSGRLLDREGTRDAGLTCVVGIYKMLNSM